MLIEPVLTRFAPLRPAPLCPEISVFHARSLVEVWEAAEAALGHELPAPFWAYPWAAGVAIARVLLDNPAAVRGRVVLDIGAGGGVSSLAAARAGAARVVANDIDPLALAIATLAARSQGLELETLEADLTLAPELVDGYGVVLGGDLAYEQHAAPRQLALLRRAARNGAWVLAADAGRTYFDARGMELLAAYRLSVPRDLEGVDERVARVYRVLPDTRTTPGP